MAKQDETAYEYVCRLTEHGAKVKLSNNSKIQNNEQKSGDKNSFICVRFMSEEKQRQKIEEAMLEKITYCAFCTDDPHTFYSHIMLVIPIAYRGGEYDSESWTDLWSHLQLAISMEGTEKSFNERFTNAPTHILSMLQSRIKNWAKKASIQAEKNEEAGIHVTVHIN